MEVRINRLWRIAKIAMIATNAKIERQNAVQSGTVRKQTFSPQNTRRAQSRGLRDAKIAMIAKNAKIER
jgi:hypothetical protein